MTGSLMLILAITFQGGIAGAFEYYWCKSKAVFDDADFYDFDGGGGRGGDGGGGGGVWDGGGDDDSASGEYEDTWQQPATTPGWSAITGFRPLYYSDRECPYYKFGPFSKFDLLDLSFLGFDVLAWLLLQLWAARVLIRVRSNLTQRIELLQFSQHEAALQGAAMLEAAAAALDAGQSVEGAGQSTGSSSAGKGSAGKGSEGQSAGTGGAATKGGATERATTPTTQHTRAVAVRRWQASHAKLNPSLKKYAHLSDRRVLDEGVNPPSALAEVGAARRIQKHVRGRQTRTGLKRTHLGSRSTRSAAGSAVGSAAGSAADSAVELMPGPAAGASRPSSSAVRRMLNATVGAPNEVDAACNIQRHARGRSSRFMLKKHKSARQIQARVRFQQARGRGDGHTHLHHGHSAEHTARAVDVLDRLDTSDGARRADDVVPCRGLPQAVSMAASSKAPGVAAAGLEATEGGRQSSYIAYHMRLLPSPPARTAPPPARTAPARPPRAHTTP